MPKAKKPDQPPHPDDLVRETAGSYRSGDGRFAVHKSDAGWFLVDSEQANEFGQQLLHGPFGTLGAVRDALPGARELRPLLRVRPRKPVGARPRKASPAKSWIDRLPPGEATRVLRMIRALEREGLPDAEDLVRRHADSGTEILATRLLEHRLFAVVDQLAPTEQKAAQELLDRMLETVTQAGATIGAPLPGWALFELGPDGRPTMSRLRPRVR